MFLARTRRSSGISSKTEQTDVLIIGGGPAGLSAARELVKRGFACILVEAGRHPGWSWTNMPENIHLLSPWKVNALAGTKVSAIEAHRQHSREQFAAYLREYSTSFDADIRCGQRVVRIDSTDDGQFDVFLDEDKSIRSRFVVNATGYFWNPHIPEFEGLDTTHIVWRHVSEYKSPRQIADLVGRDDARVLVVGKRVSAGQTLTELYDDPHTRFRVEVSARSEIEFARAPWAQHVSYWGYYTYENARILLDPAFAEDSYPPMEGGRTRRLIESGAVGVRPNIERFADHAVVFEDGERIAYDCVILATGFRPAVAHLQHLLRLDASGRPAIKDMESAEVPGLFFLGLDRQRTFRSRYLRGIREDAAVLADYIEQRASNPDRLGRTHRTVLHETRESIRRVGLLSTAALAVSRITDAAIDVALSLDTSERITLDALEIDSDTARQGQMYQPTGVAAFLRILARVPLPDEPVFVDYGSGKGRTLLLASLLPVVRVVGIEFSPDLCKTAVRNIEQFQRQGFEGAPIDVICADAAKYRYVGDENVFYFFYPFDRDLMTRVMDGIDDSLRDQPRDATLVYYYPIHRDVVDERESFQIDSEFSVFGSKCIVYRHQGGSGG